MDLRHLKYFIAVAEELHFTKAAERLHISQPPLSRQIRELEEELGVTLLNRTRRHIELSDAGKVFLTKAREVLLMADSAIIEAQRAQRGEVGKLAVGFFEQIAYTLLPPILRAFQERYPKVDVQLRWFPVIEQVDALQRGDIDIAFVRPVVDLDKVFTRAILSEPFMAVMPATHRLAQHAAIAMTDCREERIINYTRRLAPDYHDAIAGLCIGAGFAPDVAIEVGQVYTALGLVSAGVGMAFVPASVQRLVFDNLVYRPLAGATIHSEVLLAWTHVYPSALLESFVDTAQQVTGKFSADLLPSLRRPACAMIGSATSGRH
ncbi:MAG: LysR family transcriptional regulator [Herminiimonas sp.]|nr:LysR family transcriptional regulator [Herminiimonas sp.]